LIKSSEEIVILSAELKGMGRETPCTVSAVKVTLPEYRITGFVRCNIVEAPDDLPDGDYIVSLDGRALRVQRQHGEWRQSDQ